MKHFTSIFTILTMVMLSSCSEDVLDNSGESGTSQPTEKLTSAQLEDGAKTNAFIPAAFVNGI